MPAADGLQAQAGQATGQIASDAVAANNEITNNQTVAQQGVQGTLDLAANQAKAAGIQSRDLFRQTQQQNSAQLSALGISSSSVTEALAERLGVETARRIARTGDNLSQIQFNAQTELGRIKNYYTGKINDVQNQVRDQKASIQLSLIQGLNQINNARGQASQARSSARQDLLTQTRSAVYSLTQQQQQFEQSLQKWATQKSAALTPIAQDQNYLNSVISNMQNLQTNPALSGFNVTAGINQNAKSQYSSSYNIVPKKNPLDDPFAV